MMSRKSIIEIQRRGVTPKAHAFLSGKAERLVDGRSFSPSPRCQKRLGREDPLLGRWPSMYLRMAATVIHSGFR